jgi:hypothetical protein
VTEKAPKKSYMSEKASKWISCYYYYCVTQTFHCCDKYPRGQFKGKWIILAHRYRNLSPELAGCIDLGLSRNKVERERENAHLLVSREQRETEMKGQSITYILQSYALIDQLPWTMSEILMFPLPPNNNALKLGMYQ